MNSQETQANPNNRYQQALLAKINVFKLVAFNGKDQTPPLCTALPIVAKSSAADVL
jgi:hypothetical protein